MQPAIQPTLYESLEALSEGLTGEILNGQLHTQPRPSFPHGFAGSALGAKLFSAFYEGNEGPGGGGLSMSRRSTSYTMSR